MKKGKLIWIAVLLVLTLAPAAFAGLTAVGPVTPDALGNPLEPPWSADFNGFPVWYRDSLGQAVTLSIPPSPLSIPDPVIPGNLFSEHIGFGSEAMYWHSSATMTIGTGTADLGMFVEAAFGAGDATPGDQITFSRLRFRIDAPVAGDYTVIYPYGTRVFRNVAAGRRAINVTIDVGVGSPGDFTGALSGEIGPFLKQVGAPPGTLGDGATSAQVTGSPIPNANHPSGFQNFFQVIGPGVNVSTPLFITGAQLFDGTPYSITRSTYNRSAAGVFADVYATVPAPLPNGVSFRARRPDQPAGTGVLMTRDGTQFYGRVTFPNGLPPAPTVLCTGTTPGFTPTVQSATLVDAVTITKAEASRAQIRTVVYDLTIEAFSSDSSAALTADGWGAGQVAMRPPVAPGSPWTLKVANLRTPPPTITVQSTTGLGKDSAGVVVLP